MVWCYWQFQDPLGILKHIPHGQGRADYIFLSLLSKKQVRKFIKPVNLNQVFTTCTREKVVQHKTFLN